MLTQLATEPSEPPQKQRKREDRHAQLADYHRRLDSFAKLLAAHSECVAVAIISGQLHIAANELFKTSRSNNQIIRAINEIREYFQKIVKAETKEEERKAVFCEKICTAARLKLTIDASLAKQIAERVFKGENLTIQEIRKQFGANAVVAAQMYSLFSDLHEDFLKLEEACKATEEQFALLQNAINQEIKILQDEPKQTEKVHAEVQLLAKIIAYVNNSENKPKFFSDHPEIYIGVSKLCCLSCHCMLEAAQQQLTKLNINVLFRGHHDLSFSNWTPPSIFSKGYNSIYGGTDNVGETKSEGISFLIGQQGALMVEKLELQQQAVVSMYDSQSESESGETLTKRIRERGAVLNQQLVLMEGLKQYGSIDENVIRYLRIAYQLHNGSQEFIRLHQKIEDIRNIKEMQGSLGMILGELGKIQDDYKINNLTIGDIEKIMEDVNLVGEKLANSFKEIKTTGVHHNLQYGSTQGGLTKRATVPEENFGSNIDSGSSVAQASIAIANYANEGEQSSNIPRESSTPKPKPG